MALGPECRKRRLTVEFDSDRWERGLPTFEERSPQAPQLDLTRDEEVLMTASLDQVMECVKSGMGQSWIITEQLFRVAFALARPHLRVDIRALQLTPPVDAASLGAAVISAVKSLAPPMPLHIARHLTQASERLVELLRGYHSSQEMQQMLRGSRPTQVNLGVSSGRLPFDELLRMLSYSVCKHTGLHLGDADRASRGSQH